MTTRLIHLSLSLGAVLTCAASAADESPEVRTAGYHLKNQSSFRVAPELRAPFWPIGWTPSRQNVTEAEQTAPVNAITPDQFAVTSILLGSQSLAVINGRTYGEGEFIRTARLGKPATGASALPANVRVRVNRIIDGQVILQSGTKAIAVPLRRPQLTEKKPGEEELLSLSER